MSFTQVILVKREVIAENTVEIQLIPEKPYHYRPGQHADCFIGDEGRAFSFTSPSSELDIRFVMRISNSHYKQTLMTLTLGKQLTLSPPTGYFGYTIEDIPTLFIAGGVGIAPFMSLLLSFRNRHAPIHIITFNLSRSREPYSDKLTKLSETNTWLSYDHLVTSYASDRRVNWFTDILNQTLKKHGSMDLYICGPTLFINNLRIALESLEIDSAQIKSEDFGLLQFES